MIRKALLLTLAVRGLPAAACDIIDSFQDFAALAELPKERQIQAFHEDYLAKYRDIYQPSVMPAATDEQVQKALDRVAQHPEWRVFDRQFPDSFRAVAKTFAESIPQFRCDFPVHATETFNFMDGAGREVGGKPALLFGIDTIARSWTKDSLPVFLSHELFHRYHFQAAGFSDDLAERDLIWRAMWAEGLATYVSARLNPDNPLKDALMFPPDLEERAKPFIRQMAGELLAAADQTDKRVFAKFFMGGDRQAEAAGWPSRSGYYIGFLVAERLGRQADLKTLAALQGAELRAKIGEALTEL